MFKFSSDVEKVESAIEVCYDHGLYEAAEALGDDLARAKFVEVLQGIPWAGKCLAEAVVAEIIEKDDVPDNVDLTDNTVKLAFNGILEVVINLEKPDWDVDYFDNGEYDLANEDRDPEWDLDRDDDDEPSDWEREYNLDGRCDDED